jgi:hyperosmotically inducible periplasmic protein
MKGRTLMKSKLLIRLVGCVLLMAFTAFAQNELSPRSEARIIREVRHELWCFRLHRDKVDGGTVTLLGQVVRPSLKSDAENVVKGIEGVERVDNQVEILPPLPQDDRLRMALFRTIYQYPSLERYELGVQKPIRIIVRNGHVNLEGVVDSEGDKNLVGVRANGVPGIFSLHNNLQVVNP